MLTADPADRSATFRVAFLTGASIFIMGYMNSYALNTYDLGLMLTPQSGNIIWLGIYAASGYWHLFFDSLGLFLGFIIGVIFALFTQDFFKNKTTQFYFNWSVFVLPFIAYPLFMQYVLPPIVSYLVLGFACGVGLGFFRKMYHLEINNAMATGNARFLGLSFAEAFLKKNKKEVVSFWIFFLCILLYVGGAFVYTKLAQADYHLGLAGSGVLIGLGEQNIQSFRQTLGFGEHRIDVVSSNIVRYIGLLLICIIPSFFFPKSTVPAQNNEDR